MPRQESLVEERYRLSSSGGVTLAGIRRMAEGVDGVEVKGVTVNTFCRVLLAEIDGVRLNGEEVPLSLCLCDSDSTRAYLVTNRARLEDALGNDWPLANLSGIAATWADLAAKERSLYLVSVTVCGVPQTELEKGTAFRIATKRKGVTLHTSPVDSVILAYRPIGAMRLPRPDMESPYVEDVWVVLAALQSAARQGRQVAMGKILLSEAFHVSTDGDVVTEQTVKLRANATVISPLDGTGVRQLLQEVRSRVSKLQRRLESEPKTGAVGSLVEALLGEHVYPEEEVTRLRYLRLWEALADAAGTRKLHGVTELDTEDAKLLDDLRHRIAHPSRLPMGMNGEKALGKLRKASLVWIREFQ